MEIIARVDKHEYIARISRSELCNLLDKDYQEWFETGTVINVAKIYKVVDSLKKHQDTLKNQAEQLRAIALLLEPMQDIIQNTLKTGEKHDRDN